MALTEDHKETTNRLPVPDELQDGPLLGSNPPHHRPPRRQPTPSVKEVTFGIELGEAAEVEWRVGLADVSDHDLMSGPPRRITTRRASRRVKTPSAAR